MIIDSRYKVQEEMGRGPWSRVFRVHDIRDGQEYALKLFDGVTSAEFYEHFSPERMHHIKSLRHKNLIKIFDFGYFNQHIYYISEFYHEYTLEKFTFTPVSLEMLYQIIVKVCYALSALHSQDLVHQLLKPSNIGYRVENGKVEVKIMDYGFTRIDFNKPNSESNYLPYIAPEIFKNKQATPESDFYSLGVILYQITTNTKPFSTRNMHQFKDNPKLSLIPQFPRQINLSVPLPLENLILQLLDMNPSERFSSAEDIISYINDTQPKKFAFSQLRSEVNKIQLSGYIVREEYSHNMLEHVDGITSGNGKLIMLYAGKGMGKTDALVLFRYHLFTGKFFIFDYDCSPQNKDPFFALIREFYHSVDNNSKLQKNMCEISDRMNQYVFENIDLIDNNVEENLQRDFEVASEFLEILSQERPLIFTIRSCQYMTPEVVDFLNYFSKHYLPHLPILIILSVNDPRRLKGLKYAVEIKLEPLSLNDTKTYVTNLLNDHPPLEFVEQLWHRSYGNPEFIEKILIDMISREQIWVQGKRNYDVNIDTYTIPHEIREAIYLKMGHLNQWTYLKLMLVSAIKVPLTHGLLRYVLDISDQELYFLMYDGENNEILFEEDSQIKFTYQEARQRFFSECEDKQRVLISQRVTEYFGNGDQPKATGSEGVVVSVIREGDELDEIKSTNLLAYTNESSLDEEITLRGLVYHAREGGYSRRERLYQKYLAYFYSSRKEFQKAFLSMTKVIKLDGEPQCGVSCSNLRDDVYTLIEFANWIDLEHMPSAFARLVRRMESHYEKYYLLGAFNFEMERNGRAFVSFQKAYDLCDNDADKTKVQLYLGRYYVRMNKYEELKQVIADLESKDLDAESEIVLKSLKSFLLVKQKKSADAIKLINEYLKHQAGSTSPGFFVELGGIYINLGQFYNREQDYKKEEDCYHNALEIWRTIGYERKLGIVYNNLGDIALRQGKTLKAFEYFHNARIISEKVNNRTSLILSHLNYGEAYIKQGEFTRAESHLEKAQSLGNRSGNNKFRDSIINNLAIARSKLHKFSYYRNFIAQNEPELLYNRFSQVSPLVKTWFYYLNQIGDFSSLEKLLQENNDVLAAHPEFYWQSTGNLHYNRQEYTEAYTAYQNCLEYAKRNNSEYAMAIVNLHLARVCIQTGDITEARMHEKITRQLCKRNKFFYWELGIDLIQQQIDLQNKDVNLRQIIRNLIRIQNAAAAKNYFLLELDTYDTLLQIFKSLKRVKQTRKIRKELKAKILLAVEELPETEQSSFLAFHNYESDIPVKLKSKIVNRNLTESSDWTENLYELIKIREPQRVPYFIQKIFNSLFAPQQIALMQKSDILHKQKPLIQQNISLYELYTPELLSCIKKSMEKNEIMQKNIMGRNTVFVPLRIKSLQKGCLLMADNGELSFQKYEMELLGFVRLHLTAMLMRGEEFHQLNERLNLMNKLIEATGNLFQVVSVKKMQEDITRSAISMLNAVRGFFITSEGLGNYSYAVAIDESNNILNRFSHIGREVLSRVAANKLPVYVNKTRNADLVPQMASGRLHDLEIYAAPMIINEETYGYIYLDNANTPKRSLLINREFTPLFLNLMTAMLRNALRYQRLLEIEHKTDQLKIHKEKFIQIVSHELQQPVAVLRSLITTISNFQQPPELDEVMENFNQTSNDINRRINEIVEHFHFCNVDKLKLEKVELRQVLESAQHRAENYAKSRRLFFNLDLPATEIYAALDLRIFNLLLDKLITNAIRFSMDLSLTTLGLRPATTLAEKVQDMDSVIIYIKDEGIGIKQSELENIFKEFYEVNDIYSHRSGDVEFNSSGLGLGLATARRLVELHNGKIWAAANETGKGTTFYISIPVYLSLKETQT